MKLSRSLPLVLVALPLLAHCGGSSGNGNPGGGASDSGAGEAQGGDSGGGKSQGGTKQTGGTAPGGATAQGGTAPGAGETSGGDATSGTTNQAGGDAGAGGAEPTGPLTFFDYYQDGKSVFWVNPSGSGKLADLPAFPEAFRFAEGDMDNQSRVTARRTSVLYAAGGSLYRLDGSAYASTPPAPAQVSNLKNITDVCNYQAISDLSDRTQSILMFQYETTGPCKGQGVNKDLPMVTLPLVADAQTAPTSIDYRMIPLVSPYGKIAGTLMTTDDLRLIRTKSLTDTTEAQELSGKNSVYGVEQQSLGATRFLLIITRFDSSRELFVFDTSTNKLSQSLGKFTGLSYSITGVVQNDTYAFFIGVATGDNKNQIYRMPIDGSAAPTPLAGIEPTTPALQLVGLTSNRLVYRQLTPLPAGIYSIPPDADFAMPPAATTIVGHNVFPRLLSETRLFYQNGNLAEVINLDVTHEEYYSNDGNLSYWIGCSTNPQTDIPTSRQKTGNCQRVYLQSLGAGLTGGKLVSYDADADAGQDFFMNASRGTQQHGDLTDMTSSMMLVDASRSGFNPFQTASNALVTGSFLTRPTIKDNDRYAIFYLADPAKNQNSIATFQAPADSLLWMSRGP